MQMNIQIVILFAAGTLLFSACSNEKDKVITLLKIAQCDAFKTTALKKGDKVTTLIDDTQIRILHSFNGAKSACVIRGDAKVN